MAGSLSPEFADLEPFVAGWAFPTEAQRSERRWRATKSEFDAFYATMMPHLPALLGFLGQIPAAEVPETVKPLLYLVLAFAEAAPHVELYRGSPDVPFSFDPRRFVASHGAVAG